MFLFLNKKSTKAASVETLNRELADTDARLALLKAEVAAQMIKLAGQTNDLAPLRQAEESLMAARNYYSFENTPVEIGMVQTALGDMLLHLGRKASDKGAIVRARDAYRAAITLASLHGDDSQREALRKKVKLAESYMGLRKITPPLFRVA